MKTFPIETMDIQKAKNMQFKLVDTIHRHFNGYDFLQGGDYGVVPGLGRPNQTKKVEEVLADFFDVERAMLVRGAGTGAIRSVMNGVLKPGQRILLHDAPIYPTTKVIVDSMGLEPVYMDFNNIDAIDSIYEDIDFALLQHSRQKIDDSYDLEYVINKLKSINKNINILVDDNYVALKAEKIGVQLGADSSAFSLFKLLGPEGIGCVLGKKEIIDKIRKLNYSGGGQVQGFEAMEALRSIVYTPVALAIQGEVSNEIVERLNKKEVPGIKSAFIANAQSRVVLIELNEPIAKKILEIAPTLGAAPYPVGAESRYEICSMFYRVSGTFLESDPSLEDYMIRINPMRAGADTVLRVLTEAMTQVMKEGS